MLASEVGTTFDGKIMCVFRVPNTRKIVYFLFDVMSGSIARCNANGNLAARAQWMNISPRQFVKAFWGGGEVSVLDKIFVFGLPLTKYRRECLLDTLAFFVELSCYPCPREKLIEPVGSAPHRQLPRLRDSAPHRLGSRSDSRCYPRRRQLLVRARAAGASNPVSRQPVCARRPRAQALF